MPRTRQQQPSGTKPVADGAVLKAYGALLLLFVLLSLLAAVPAIGESLGTVPTDGVKTILGALLGVLSSRQYARYPHGRDEPASEQPSN